MVEFNRDTLTTGTVTLDGEYYGRLNFDGVVWVLWPADIEDAVSYEPGWGETTKMIAYELEEGKNN